MLQLIMSSYSSGVILATTCHPLGPSLQRNGWPGINRSLTNTPSNVHLVHRVVVKTAANTAPAAWVPSVGGGGVGMSLQQPKAPLPCIPCLRQDWGRASWRGAACTQPWSSSIKQSSWLRKQAYSTPLCSALYVVLQASRDKLHAPRNG